MPKSVNTVPEFPFLASQWMRQQETTFYSTSGSSFVMYPEPRSGHFEVSVPKRFCAYCHQQKDELNCPSCGARRDLEPEAPIGRVSASTVYYEPKKKGFLERILS